MLRKLGIIITSLSVLAGCSGLNTFPLAARGGDTVVVAAGSAEGMTASNVTAEFTSDVDGSVVDLTPNIRSVLKFFPDKTSSTSLNQTDLFFKQGHEPWLSTIVIDLPFSIPDGGILPVGDGSINVSCTPQASCTYPQLVPHTNDVDAAIKILPGLGEPNPFQYEGGLLGSLTADPQALQPQTQVQVVANVPNGIDLGGINGPTMGAAEFTINVPTADVIGGVVQDKDIVVVAQEITSYSGSQRNLIWKRIGDDITVMFTSPYGMKFTELRFAIVLKANTGLNDAPNLFTASPTIVSESYYDINGDLITVDMPTLSVALIN